MSLKFRFSLIFASLLGVIHLVFSLSIYWVSYNFRQVEFYEKLQDRAILLTQLAAEFDSFNHQLFLQFSSRPHFTLDDENINIYGEDNVLLFSNHPEKKQFNFLDKMDLIKKNGNVRFDNGLMECVGIEVKFKGKTFTTFIEAHDYSRAHKLNELKKQLIVIFFAGFVLISLISVILANQMIKPILLLIYQIRNTTLNNLKSRLEFKRKDEIGELAQSYNLMIDRLEKGFKAQKQFVANASHELRTPLASIKNIIQVALQQDRTEEYYRNLLIKVLDQINRMIKLSNGLLDLAKANIDKSNVIMNKLDLTEILWHATEILTTEHKNYKIKISYEGLDEGSEVDYWGSEHLLQLLILNVIENACKFSENQTADIILKKDNNKLSLLVKDSGIGIDEEDLMKITEPAYRGKNVKGISGQGIGLALVKSVADLHNIRLKIDSKLNHGTSVEVIF
jgi:signal transduction histidine kinase